MCNDSLAADIASTLRSLIPVPTPDPNGLFVRHNIWQRCQRIAPDAQERWLDPIYVDGIAGECRWNSWQVFDMQLEQGLTLWMGYAFFADRWVEHSWCMLDGRIVESTAPFRIYYGAQLVAKEIDVVSKERNQCDFTERDGMRVWTTTDRGREDVPFKSDPYAATIGRERDKQGRLVDGLGRVRREIT